MLAAVVAGTILYRSSRQLATPIVAEADLAKLAARQNNATRELAASVAGLTNYLLDQQRRDSVPEKFDDWAQAQQQAHTFISSLPELLTALEAPRTFSVPVAPEVTHALARFHSLTTTLTQHWNEYDQMGSGLTSRSNAYAMSTLLPLVRGEIRPGLAALQSALRTERENLSGAASATDSPGRTRPICILVMIAALLAAGAAVAAPSRSRRKNAPPPLATSLLIQAEQKIAPPPMPVMADYTQVAASLPQGKPKILIVEHDSASRELLTVLVGGAGYGVVGCAHTAEALAAVKAISFQLAVLDQQLPSSGCSEILFEVRRGNPDAPVIFLADQTHPPISASATSHRVLGFLRRPADPQKLLALIFDVLPIERTIVEIPEPPPDPDAPNFVVPPPPPRPVPARAPQPPPPAPPKPSPPPPAPLPPPPPPAPAPLPLTPLPAELAPEPEQPPPAEEAPKSDQPRKRLVRRKVITPDEPPSS